MNNCKHKELFVVAYNNTISHTPQFRARCMKCKETVFDTVNTEYEEGINKVNQFIERNKDNIEIIADAACLDLCKKFDIKPCQFNK
ncbi:hypothetical protein [Alkaliphilus sp. B6464]|uniref:hypothetical protein n=1 Tax=Alkaliphilus sp. B6464 TaxID=2731219 RepID=UPI001BAACDC6|nr:hypothetical protein [Alkaliphilus sp. B6464]QUH21766.1 hypothetical protein HYG84_17675 [Alkaliphilus sp. B6464]